MYINQLSTMQTVLSPAVRSKLLMCHTGHGIAAEAVFHWFILHGPLFLPTMIRLSKTSRDVSEVCSAYCDVTIKLSWKYTRLPVDSFVSWDTDVFGAVRLLEGRWGSGNLTRCTVTGSCGEAVRCGIVCSVQVLVGVHWLINR